jgi:predicted ATP-grasp superfamily ATP-dependent carboligase
MTRIFLYEHLTAGALDAADAAASHHLRAQGEAMRDAVAADLLADPAFELTIAAPDADEPLPAGARRACPVPGEAAVAFVAREAARHDAAWIVAPETDGVLAVLAGAVSGLAGGVADARRCRWIGCSAGAIALASSKGATVERLATYRVRTPRALEREAGPWMTKPDDGAGALDTRRWPSRAAALAHSRHAPRLWAEPWVAGDAFSLALRCGAGGAELLAVNRQHVRCDDAGELTFDGVTIDVMARDDARRRTLDALAHAVLRAVPGLRGYVGVDFVWHPAHGPVAIEINPRVTSAYVGLSARLGRNLGAEIVNEHVRA